MSLSDLDEYGKSEIQLESNSKKKEIADTTSLNIIISNSEKEMRGQVPQIVDLFISDPLQSLWLDQVDKADPYKSNSKSKDFACDLEDGPGFSQNP